MPPKKKTADLDDSDLSFSDDDEPVKKKAAPPKKKTAPARGRKADVVQPTTSALVGGDEPAVDDDDIGDEHRLYEYDDDNLLEMEIPPPPEPIMASDGTGKRLMIKEIVVTNFKSYYGRQVIGPFHKNFTAIIGPNGSGKSNVIDSLLFVFGFRASRIRLKALKELIHNSSGKERPRSCTVEVKFQQIVDLDNDNFEIVPGSEFSVSRTATSDSASKYTINGKTVTGKEVILKLREVGIDLIHNRFLILQGEVEQIAMMKPKATEAGKEGMLEYLEDIIGSSRFKEPIERLTDKLDKLVAERQQQSHRVAVAENERSSMEGPVKELLRFLRIQNQITLIEHKLLTLKRLKYKDRIAKQQPCVEAKKEEIAVAEKHIEEVVAKKEDANKESMNLQREKDEKQRELDKVHKEISSFEEKEAKRKAEHKRASNELFKAQNQVKKLEDELEVILQVPEQADSIIGLNENEIKELDEQIQEAENKVSENTPKFEKKATTFKEEKTEAEMAMNEKQEIVLDAKSHLEIAETELKNLLSEQTTTNERLESYKASYKEQSESLASRQKELDAVNEKMPEAESNLDKARQRQAALRKEIEVLDQELRRARHKLGEANESHAQRSHGSQATTVLVRAAEEGKLTGYIGRLGDLAALDKKYDAAVSTTVPNLYSYVVETKEDALKAVQVLVDNGVPRHNFLVMAEMDEHPNMNKDPKQFPAPRIFDLLQITESRLRKVFYAQTRDSLIVKDLSEAKNISDLCKRDNRGNFRFVTLDGGVLDTAGTISGGGKPRTGAIGQQAAASAKDIQANNERISELRRREAELDEKYKNLCNEQRQVDQEIYQNDRMVRDCANRKRLLDNEVRTLSTKAENVKKQVTFYTEQLSRVKVDEKELKSINLKIEKFTEEKQAAQQEYDIAKEKFKRAGDRLDKLWNELCGRHSNEAKEAREKKEQCLRRIAEQRSKLASFERDKKKLEKRLDDANQAVSNKEKLEEKWRKNEEEYENLQETQNSNKKRLEAEIQELEGQIKDMRSRNAHLYEDEGKAVRELASLKDELAESETVLRTLMDSITAIEKQIDGLKLHTISVDLLPSKMRNPADDEHYLDDDMIAEDQEIQKKMKKDKKKKRQVGEDECEDEDGTGDDGQLPNLSEEELQNIDRDDLKFKLQNLKSLEAAGKKDINMNIIDDYREKLAKLKIEKDALAAVSKRYNDHLNLQETLKKKRIIEFMDGFSQIGLALKEMYQMITLGGDASLDIKNQLDPFADGISFMVRPPKKTWKQIENLSGGEKTLSSLALVFALHKYRPTPLYVMDEIDAALDFRNVSIIGHYVQERTKNAQFIIISLRNNMFELGDRLVGIYKTHDCTKNAVIDPKALMEEAKKYQEAIKQVHEIETSFSEALPGNATRKTLQIDGQDRDRSPDSTRKRLSSESFSTANGLAKKLDDRASPTSDPQRRPRRHLAQSLENGILEEYRTNDGDDSF